MSGSDDRSTTQPPRALSSIATTTVVVPLTGQPDRPFPVVRLPDGRRALALFTSRDALARAAEDHDFADARGELRPTDAPGRLALSHVARAQLDAVVIDLGSSAVLVATRAEVEAALAAHQRRTPSTTRLRAVGAAPSVAPTDAVAAPTTQPPHAAPRSHLPPPSAAPLPRTDSAAPSRRPSRSLPSVAPGPAPAPRVLVVDDDATVLSMVRRFLVAQGAAVEVSLGPFGVTGLVARQQPSVLVLDVTMPALDGEQLASLVRTVPGAPEVVFFSAVGDRALTEIAARVGDVDAVSKSAGLDALWDAIRRADRRHRR